MKIKFCAKAYVYKLLRNKFFKVLRFYYVIKTVLGMHKYKLHSEEIFNYYPTYQQKKILELFPISFQKEIFNSYGAMSILTSARSQIGQDLLALLICNYIKAKMRNQINNSHVGLDNTFYFIEFGACDGLKFSNTWILEKFFSWKGLLVEPGRNWHSDLKKNRNVLIDFRAIGGENRICTFIEEKESPTYSSIDKFKREIDCPEKTSRYNVDVIKLSDLLVTYNAPRDIDYLSIDTEGNEIEILQTFDFTSYSFNLITIEHNNRPERIHLNDLLNKNGYIEIAKLSQISGGDGWYLNQKYAVLFPQLFCK